MKTLDEITPDIGFLQAILNAIPSGIFVTDREHNILLINDGGAALVGRSPGDCFDRKCYDVFDTFICKTDFCNCRLAVQNNIAQHGVTIMRVDGKEIPIEYVGRPLKNYEGEIVGCVEHFTDITDRLAKEKTITEQHDQVLNLLKEKTSRNLELDRANSELLQLTQDLEALAQERTIAEMALQIADQIRNPTTAIGGLTRSLMKKMPEDIQQARKLQAIVHEVQLLEDRVNNFEKLAQEQKKLFVREDLREIVAEVLNTWSSELIKKDVQLITKKPAKIVNIIANRRTLKVALLHILRNAVEASPESSEIKIEIFTKNGNPAISITDQGKGIPKKIKPKLFERTVTTKTKGLGMGLMLVKQIMREHQGKIEIESTSRKGTTVTLRFPLLWEEKKLSQFTCPPQCIIT